MYWVDTDNFQSVWLEEPICEKFSYTLDKDLFPGRCDIKAAGGAASAPFCCKLCWNTSGCKAFTYASSTCYLKSACSAVDASIATNTRKGGLITTDVVKKGAVSGVLKQKVSHSSGTPKL